MFGSAIIWKTSDGEKEYVTPSGWPLTKKARKLAEKFDHILTKKMKVVKKELRKQGYFKMKPGILKYHLLGKNLHVLDIIALSCPCINKFKISLGKPIKLFEFILKY